MRSLDMVWMISRILSLKEGGIHLITVLKYLSERLDSLSKRFPNWSRSVFPFFVRL